MLPQPSSSSGLKFDGSTQLSSFRPHSASALRTGLFRSAQTLAVLRSEAADRFLRWSEVERAVEGMRHNIPMDLQMPKEEEEKERLLDATEHWNKAEWETSLSEDIARRMRSADTESCVVNEVGQRVQRSRRYTSCHGPLLDPLHVPSLLVLSVSLLRAKLCTPTASIYSEISIAASRWAGWRFGLALLGVFCGVGIGLAFSG